MLSVEAHPWYTLTVARAGVLMFSAGARTLYRCKNELAEITCLSSLSPEFHMYTVV